MEFQNIVVTLFCSFLFMGFFSADFDGDLKKLLPEIAKNRHVKHLAIGRNFNSIKPK